MLPQKRRLAIAVSCIVLGVIISSPQKIYAHDTVNAANKVQVSEDSRLMNFFERTWSTHLDNFPEFKTAIGIKDEDYGKWNDRSDAYAIKLFEQRKTDLAFLLKNFDYQKLSPQKRVSYDFYKQVL